VDLLRTLCRYEQVQAELARLIEDAADVLIHEQVRFVNDEVKGKGLLRPFRAVRSLDKEVMDKHGAQHPCRAGRRPDCRTDCQSVLSCGWRTY
jgi:hypothetical protein